MVSPFEERLQSSVLSLQAQQQKRQNQQQRQADNNLLMRRRQTAQPPYITVMGAKALSIHSSGGAGRRQAANKGPFLLTAKGNSL
jgi:hypothetical protein